MDKIEKIEQEVQALSAEELAQFRAWFLEYDWAARDRQIERDSHEGRLDDLATKALRDHAAGKTTPLRLITRLPTYGRCIGPCRLRYAISPIKLTRA